MRHYFSIHLCKQDQPKSWFIFQTSSDIHLLYSPYKQLANNQTSLPVSTTIIILSTVIPSTLVLLMLVCTVVVIILIVRRRITRKQVDATHEHLEMSTSEAYITNTAEIATTERRTYMTHGILSSLALNRM